jgi:hypothetical protein
MQSNFKKVSRTILLALTLSCPILAQDVRIEMGKHATPIPRICVSAAPAKIEDKNIDIPALVKEAMCKGAGDMLSDFTYVVDSVEREKDKKGRVKEERVTYEVFIPTLKSGARTRGVKVVTSRNGVPVPAAELEKERLRAAERIEKEEAKIERENPAPADVNPVPVTGMMPLGTYGRTGINRSALGRRRGGVLLAIHTFLRTCELTFVRRDSTDREALVFSFTPRPNAQFTEDDKYIAQLTGEIWIDVQDRIVTRLSGRPLGTPPEQPPAVYVEMMRLPQHSVWLLRMNRINGADYPTLFDHITNDSTSTHSNYIRFSAEVNDVKVGTPNN